MSSSNHIRVRGARVHNLKNVDLDIPRNRLVVFTGPSGSGKSSMAFDTLFAEGQRRYVESMSVYARQYLNRLEKPDADEIRGLSPTISIEQKATSNNPRSTVGTITEIYDHIRVLYSKIGEQRCYQCGEPVGSATPARIVEQLLSLEAGTKFQILAPLIRNRKGEFRDLFESLRKNGFSRARVDREFVLIETIDKLHKETRHTIDVVVDRLVMKPDIEERVRIAVERCLSIAEGQLSVLYDSGEMKGRERLYSTANYCVPCNIAYPPLTHQSFSFNSPLGRCPDCHGLGTERRMSEKRVIPDPTLSLNKDCVEPLSGYNTKEDRLFVRTLAGFCKHHDISMKTPWAELSDEERQLVLHGVEKVESIAIPGRKTRRRIAFEGVLGYLLYKYDTADTEAKQLYYQQYLSNEPCSACDGTRLRPESRSVVIDEVPVTSVVASDLVDAQRFFAELELKGRDHLIGEEIRREIAERLGFLLNVGLSYLTLSRPGPSLSGGEAQRIRLASQLGSRLSGVLYVLDEPSIGLHQRDNQRLINTLVGLRDLGNHVVVVEHDRDTMEQADWVVDFGPGAGVRGGAVTFSGTPAQLAASEGNVTGDYLAGRKVIEVPEKRRAGSGKALRVVGAREHNLKNVTVDFPLGTFIAVTGVSGAGKSTLVNEILFPATHNKAYRTDHRVGVCKAVEGLDHIDKVIQIDQRPIGRTPRSNPATYTKVFDEIRKLFSELPESRIYGYKPGRFSFNTGGGRCGHCSGNGVERIEMRFLADVEVPCPVCRGKRFNDATLRVKYDGHSISDVLDMPIEEAAELFGPHRKIARTLNTLVDVGLGYLTLGQSSTTLSGGEAQRVKLARELRKIATGDTLYILDEPSTGLHFEDIRKLLDVVHRLVDAGNTVIIIEHNLDIIKAADHVIDVGPDGGSAGGEIVAVGSPEDIANVDVGYTSRFVREELERTAPKARVG